ncbi:hypothetical protein P7K49_040305, partial [Saguinus oedipus]
GPRFPVIQEGWIKRFQSLSIHDPSSGVQRQVQVHVLSCAHVLAPVALAVVQHGV